MLYIILMHISHVMWDLLMTYLLLIFTIQKWYEAKANLRSVLLWQNRQWNRWGNWQQPQNWQWACSTTVDKDTVQRHRSPEVRSQEPCPWEGSWQWGSEHSLTLILTCDLILSVSLCNLLEHLKPKWEGEKGWQAGSWLNKKKFKVWAVIPLTLFLVRLRHVTNISCAWLLVMTSPTARRSKDLPKDKLVPKQGHDHCLLVWSTAASEFSEAIMSEIWAQRIKKRSTENCDACSQHWSTGTAWIHH